MDMQDSLGASVPTLIPADKSQRAFGYLIDVLPLLLIGLISLIPFVGIILYGFILIFYWLLRDITGGSLGKMAMGIKVVAKDGGPASMGARILRNATLAVPGLVLAIPLVGYIGGPVCGSTMVLLEVFMLLGSGERVGDKIAGTVVVKKG